MRNKTTLFLIILAAFSSGCAMVKSQSDKKLMLTPSWARHTIQGEYLGARLNHIMEPILYKDLVIQGNEIDGLVAYNKKFGWVKWRKRIDGGVTSSARVADDILYFGGGDGFFYAIELPSGDVKWTFPIRSEGLGAPLIEGGVVYFLSGNNTAYALKAQSGEQVWYYNRIDPANITVRGASEPTIVGEKVYMGFSDGTIVALEKKSGKVLWEKSLGESQRFKDVDSKPVFGSGKIYVSNYDGKLYCLSAADGRELWAHEDGGFAPVTVDGDRIYFSTSSRKVMALEKTSGKVIWSKSLNGTVAGQPAYHKGVLLFGEWDGKLRAVNAQNGEELAYYDTGRGVTSSPVIDPETSRVLVMTADANLYSLQMDWKTINTTWPWE